MLLIKSNLIVKAFPNGHKAMGSNSTLSSAQLLHACISDNTVGVRLGTETV